MKLYTISFHLAEEEQAMLEELVAEQQAWQDRQERPIAPVTSERWLMIRPVIAIRERYAELLKERKASAEQA